MNMYRALFLATCSCTLLISVVSTNKPKDIKHWNSLEDTYSLSLLLDINETHIVKEHWYDNGDLPLQCRIDVCPDDETHTTFVGDFRWPITVVGMRRYVKCPYAYEKVVYASRACLPLDGYNITWSMHNVSECPGPPMQALMNKYDRKMKSNSTLGTTFWKQAIKDIYDVTEDHPRDPVTSEDLDSLVEIIDTFLKHTRFLSGCVLEKDLQRIITICDYLFGLSYNTWIRSRNKSKVRLLKQLETVVQKLPPYSALAQNVQDLQANVWVVEEPRMRAVDICFRKSMPNGRNPDCVVSIEISLETPGVEVHSMVLREEIHFQPFFFMYMPEDSDVFPPVIPHGFRPPMHPPSMGKPASGPNPGGGSPRWPTGRVGRPQSGGVPTGPISWGGRPVSPTTSGRPASWGGTAGWPTSSRGRGQVPPPPLALPPPVGDSSHGRSVRSASATNTSFFSVVIPPDSVPGASAPLNDSVADASNNSDHSARSTGDSVRLPTGPEISEASPDVSLPPIRSLHSPDRPYTSQANNSENIETTTVYVAEPAFVSDNTGNNPTITPTIPDDSNEPYVFMTRPSPGPGAKPSRYIQYGLKIRGPLVYLSIGTPGVNYSAVFKQVILSFSLTGNLSPDYTQSGSHTCAHLLESDIDENKKLWMSASKSYTLPTILKMSNRIRFKKTLTVNNFKLDVTQEFIWDSDNCQTDVGLDEVTCRCNKTAGYFGVFVRFAEGVVSVPPTIPTTKVPPGVNQLLGFPYSYELSIVSLVLRAISMICLLVTVASFIAFRKARRGTPTYILLNLCVALIILNVVLYIVLAMQPSKVGCRASNILRYYLILVTLLWNAVEAVNMYQMLVTVFDKQMPKFTTKAAFVAWGLPGLPIIVLLAISLKSFDGYYVDCQFRCLLTEPVLYYGLLVPIGLIMLFNMIIFAIAFSVIIKLGRIDSKGKKSRWLNRLIGAVALLVLLGVPWLFAGFGAIDADSKPVMKMVEGVFQVIFTVLFNAQGIFIFIFHCARNTDMRSSWKSSLTKMSTKDSHLSNSSGQRRATPEVSNASTIRNKCGTYEVAKTRF